jgi:RNA polymerase sigma-70 factor (ECF subfamily)
MDTNGNENLKIKKFMALLVPNQRRINAYILCLVPNSSDADDILQETLAEIWNKFDDFEEGSNFIAWSLTIARYKVLSFRQKNKNSKVLFSDNVNELLETESKKSLDLVQEEIEGLKHCMKKLPDKQKNYVLMRYEQGLSFRAIASQVGVSMQAAYKTVCRIHSNLAKCVQMYLNMEGR